MSRTDRQAATAAVLMSLGAPTPWWPKTASGHIVSDANGEPLFFIFPAAGRDRNALARAICRDVNETAGERQPDAAAPLDPDHLDAVREETERAGRQMGRRAGGGR